MKAYLKNYESFKSSYLKKFLYHKEELLLANLDPGAALYEEKWSWD